MQKQGIPRIEPFRKWLVAILYSQFAIKFQMAYSFPLDSQASMFRLVVPIKNILQKISVT